jgi:flagellar biogenesis protein FliO
VVGFVAAGVIALTVSAARADDPPQRPWLAPAPSAAPAAPAAPAAQSTPISWRSSLLIAVSAALGGAAVWVRSRKGSGALAKLTSSRELRVISSVRVGPKGHLVLAGIGDRALLLGVTDSAVRRIAWLPADQIANNAAVIPADALREAPAIPEGARTRNTALVTTGVGSVLESAHTPADPAVHAPHKGAFADILRRLGGRQVDAPPAESQEKSPAATLAELRRDSVQWSQGATNAASASSPRNATAARGAAPAEHDGHELEQQAAGILKHRSRRRV